jgi:DNA-binding SARP family transcriptional activator
MLSVYLFGTPRILMNNQLIAISRRSARTLLFYLAAQEKPVSRARLAALFWPDLPEAESRENLRDLLSKLRQGLAPRQDVLLTRQENVSLDFSKVEVDYLQFCQHIESVAGPVFRLPSRESLAPAQYYSLQRSIQLWDGQEFLSGYDLSNSDSLDRWRTQICAEIDNQVLAILERLAEYDILHGNIEKAVLWLSRAARLDYYNDVLQKRLVETYLQAGMQSQARQQYEQFKQFWVRESPAELPGYLTSLEPRVYKPTSDFLSELDNRWPIKTSTQVPFVGQQGVIQELEQAWRTGDTVLVLGEAGSGKTRLAQEFFQRILPGPRLMLGACQSLESNQPFSPWVGMLRHAVHPQEWRSLDIVWARSLSLLLPELSALREELPSAYMLKPEIPRSVLVESIHQTLLLLSREGPLFVFIDDVQWADETSLAVVAHLLQNKFFSPGRSILLMASRLEEQNPLLDSLLLSPTHQRIRQIQLPALELSEIGEMSESVLGQPLPEAFLEKLDRDTGGNPFFLLEVLQSLLEKGLPEDFSQMENLPLPHSVHELIQHRLRALYPDALEVLSTAALIGSQFSLDLIESATHFLPEVTARILDELERARLLQPVPVDPTIYGFPHEKIRESLLVDISPVRKRLFHQNIARALEKSLGQQTGPQAASLAYHYEQAGNFSEAFEYWSLAGRHAHRLASFREGVTAFERAQRLIARTPGLDEQDLYQFYASWNDALFQSDQPQALKRINQALLALGQERQSPLLIGTALSGMSDAYMAENDFEAALKSIQEALEYVRLSGNEYEMVRTLDRVGVYHYMLNRLPESQPYFQQSLDISRDSVDSLMVFQRCSTHYQMAITATLGGYPLQGLEYARKTLDDAVRAYHPHGQVLAYSVMGLAYYLMGDFEAGVQACQQGVKFEHTQAWRMLGYISSYYAMNAAEIGLLSTAWEYAEKAIEIGKRQGHGEVVGLGYKAMGDIYLRLDADEEAIKAYQRGLNAAGEHFVALENLHRLGYLLYRQGQMSMGREYIQRVLDVSRESNLWSIHFLALLHQFEILSAENRLEEFEQAADWLAGQSIERMGQDVTRASRQQVKMGRALRENDFEQVLELAKETLPWYRKRNIVWRELECLRFLMVARKNLGQDVELEAERIKFLLNRVDENVENASLRPPWERFKQKILQF